MKQDEDFDNSIEEEKIIQIDDININEDELIEFIDDIEDFENEILNDIENDSTNNCDEESDNVDIMVKFNTNNHKLEGKHSLARDTIFKGKIENVNEHSEYYTNQDDFNINEGLPIEVGSSYEFESKYYEDYVGRLNLSRDVYDLLSANTELDFSSNRRKPNKQAFNDYYKMLLNSIGKDYTKSEIFVELSYYFTDNIFNMFKLLDKEYATQIIVELKQSGYLTNLNNINFI